MKPDTPEHCLRGQKLTGWKEWRFLCVSIYHVGQKTSGTSSMTKAERTLWATWSTIHCLARSFFYRGESRKRNFYLRIKKLAGENEHVEWLSSYFHQQIPMLCFITKLILLFAWKKATKHCDIEFPGRLQILFWGTNYHVTHSVTQCQLFRSRTTVVLKVYACGHICMKYSS